MSFPLNPAQSEAVRRTDVPMLVLAGAGSGKTRVITAKIAHLVAQGTDPSRVVAITFTNKAAREMRERANALLGAAGRKDDAARVRIATFHALGLAIVRAEAKSLGLKPGFSVLDPQDLESIVAELVATADRSRTRKAQWKISQWKNALATPAEALRAAKDDEEAVAAKAYAHYADALAAYQAVDFDDLIRLPVELLERDAQARARWQAMSEHVLVDEYQDTNRLQARILPALKPDGRGVTVVGDDAQAIYGFRAADVDNLLEFPQRFTPPARMLMLERNYRSTQPLLAAANAVIAQASRRFAKTLWSDKASSHKPQLVHVADEADQARWVADAVLRQREEGTKLTQQAVLFRTSHHSGPLEIELARRNIPFVKFGGLKFLDAAHVKDLLALLRFAENPRDRVAGFRVIQILPGIGPAHAGRALDRVAEAEDPAEALEIFEPPARAAEDWRDLAALYRRLVAREADWPAELDLIRRWYRPHLERRHDDTAPRSADLDQLERIAAGFPTRERFMTELTLDPPAAASDESGPPLKDEDYLILSTIHSAKGQEWAQVFVLNAVDGCLPSDLATGSSEEIEEERRLLYVAMTRARDSLRLLIPQRFHIHGQPRRGDRHVYAARSRFLTDGTLPHFAQVSWPPPRPDADSPPPMGPRRDLTARVREMWG